MNTCNEEYARTVEELRHRAEDQSFRRMSAGTDASEAGDAVIAMAGAGGGEIAIGIEDNGDVTGVDGQMDRLGKLLVATLYCSPSLEVHLKALECADAQGRQNHVLLMRVSPASSVVQGMAGDACRRAGGRMARPGLDERERLIISNGEFRYEDMPARGASDGDLDLDRIRSCMRRFGCRKGEGEFLRENGFIAGGGGAATNAAVLLFGKDPQKFLKRAYVRFLRYEGSSEQSGSELDVVKDAVFGGTILEMIAWAEDFISPQVREYSFLGPDCVFTRIPRVSGVLLEGAAGQCRGAPGLLDPRHACGDQDVR